MSRLIWLMPNWKQVLEEIQSSKRKDSLDCVRRKYIKLLSKKTNRNTIAYYSGWLQNPNSANASIGDDDKNALMAVTHKLDRSKGLDLILHTPGGDLAATESIVDYLHRMYGRNIRAIVPQLAMSAGTMIACSCSEIVMGKQSNLGPIDPQFGGIPAHGVIKEFEEAIQAAKTDPASIPIWQVVVQKYHPTFIGECRNALVWAEEIVKKWLMEGMFSDEKNLILRASKADKIVKFLGDHDATKSHSRHITINEAEDVGLKIVHLEKDQVLQDLVLTVHHAFMHTFSQSRALKIVENQLDNAVMILGQKG